MTVSVVGTGSAPTYVSDMSVQLWPDRPVQVTWPQALKLTDRRLARVVTFHGLDGFKAPPWLYWLSPFSQGDGYATAAESMAYELMRQGVKLSVHYSWFLVKEGLRPEILSELANPLADSCMVGVCMATPGEFEKLPTPIRVGFTMYESTNPLRVYPEWRHQCNNVDFLFVPSQYCKDVFSQFVNVPIKVVPLAINDKYCTPKLHKRRKTFRVVTFATLTGRKSPIEMIDVFQRAFPKEQDVEFVLKTRLDLLGSKTPSLPEITDERIRIASATWPRDKIHKLLDASDCMLFLSKGEGFGMTPREAMATGLPVVLADNSGMSDVCNSKYNWPVPTSHLEASPLGGEWAVPDWDYAVDVLRDIYKHRKRAYDKAYRGAKWFNDKHGPDAAAGKFVETLYSLGNLETVFSETLERRNQLPDFAEVPSLVHRELSSYLNGSRPVHVNSYHSINSVEVKGACVVLGQRITSMSAEQLRFAVDYLMASGAKLVMVAVPSVYEAPGQWKITTPWRLECLQHTLAGLTVPVLRYVADHTWILAVVTRPQEGQRLKSFGHVIDGRWKPT